MSYRKNHYPAKPEKKEKDFPLSDVEYSNSGTERALFTGRLTSGLPHQRPVKISFTDTDATLKERMLSYIRSKC